MPDGLSGADRARVLKELDSVAFDLNATAVVLDQAGAAAAAGMLERAAVELAAACWVLSEPLRKPSAD